MHIAIQSKLYARPDKGNHSWSMDEDACYVFLAILLFPVMLPRRCMFGGYIETVKIRLLRMPWAEISSTIYGSYSVYSSCDKSKTNKDNRAANIRAFYSLITERYQKFMLLQRNISIDETMLPYDGRHPSKQFICRNAMEYGIKLWALAPSNVCVIQFDPYKGTTSSSTNLGLRPSVILKSIESNWHSHH